MLRHVHFYMKGGELPFAASAKSKGQREESGRSGHQPVFSVEQTQRKLAVSQYCRKLPAHLVITLATRYFSCGLVGQFEDTVPIRERSITSKLP
jgi:hypothetical protein